MFSGGIDSCGVLHRLISDRDYQNRELIVQHIVLQNRENRAMAELASVNKIIDYYQQEFPNRPFTYTESVFNTTGRNVCDYGFICRVENRERFTVACVAPLAVDVQLSVLDHEPALGFIRVTKLGWRAVEIFQKRNR